MNNKYKVLGCLITLLAEQNVQADYVNFGDMITSKQQSNQTQRNIGLMNIFFNLTQDQQKEELEAIQSWYTPDKLIVPGANELLKYFLSIVQGEKIDYYMFDEGNSYSLTLLALDNLNALFTAHVYRDRAVNSFLDEEIGKLIKQNSVITSPLSASPLSSSSSTAKREKIKLDASFPPLSIPVSSSPVLDFENIMELENITKPKGEKRNYSNGKYDDSSLLQSDNENNGIYLPPEKKRKVAAKL